MAPSIPLDGIDPDKDYKLFPQVTISDEYYTDFLGVVGRIRSREEWGAKPSRRAPTDQPLWDPLRYVVFSSFHTSQKDFLFPHPAMQELQRRDQDELGLPDIQCNWVIAEDGSVLEARHWVCRPGNSHLYPGFEGRYAEITFLGDYRSNLSVKAFMQFIRYSQVFQYLRKDLRLLEDKRFLKKTY